MDWEAMAFLGVYHGINPGMGWWAPSGPAPERGALDININAALDYDGPYDPISGSSDIRGLACRVTAISG